MNFLTSSFLKPFFYQQFQVLDSLEQWHKPGRISALFTGLAKALLFLILILMELRGIQRSQLSSSPGFAVLLDLWIQQAHLLSGDLLFGYLNRRNSQ